MSDDHLQQWSAHILKELSRLNDLVERRFTELDRKLDESNERRSEIKTDLAVLSSVTGTHTDEIGKLRKRQEAQAEEIGKVKISIVKRLGWGALGGGVVTGLTELIKLLVT